MITIRLPFANYAVSALALSDYHLGVIRFAAFDVAHRALLRGGWATDEAIQPWVDHEESLCLLLSVLGREIVRRGMRTVVPEAFLADGRRGPHFWRADQLPEVATDQTCPPPVWLSDEAARAADRRWLATDRPGEYPDSWRAE